ncbi:MAG: VWA domain-containing protein [Firmicutes bacterium]|nr:VWA domain-containing protein [Bacillota bacterium]
MQDNLLVRLEDLVNNPTPRVPVCLCLDTSGSMQGKPIDELNEGVKMFYKAIREDETAMYSAEISIVTFGGTAELIADFANIDRQSEPTLTASGTTPMGEAVNMALDCLEKRKEEYKDKGVDYYQPWLVLMTDGAPYGGSADEVTRAISRTVEMAQNKKLTVFPIGIGSGADMKVLEQFSPQREPLRLQGLKFRELFAWLSESISRTSQSTPGERVELNVEGIKGWAEI